MELPKELKSEIEEYCKLNDITSVENFVLRLIKQGFITEKWGIAPDIKRNNITQISKEEDSRVIEDKVDKIVTNNNKETPTPQKKDIYGENK